MLKTLRRLALATGLALAVGLVGPAAILPASAADDSQAATIAFVDVARIMRESAAAKSLRAQLEKQEGSYEAEIKTQTDNLRKDEDALRKSRAASTPEAFATKQQEFQTKVDALRQQVERRRQQMAFAQDDAMRKLEPILAKVVAEVAKEVGASIVLDTGRVLVSSNNLNITDQVLSRLDSQISTLTVNFNAPPPTAGGALSAPSGGSAPPPPPPLRNRQ